MTKWLADIVGAVPPDFSLPKELSYELPKSAEVLGRLPEECVPILRAYLYLLSEARNREDGTGVRRSFWENQQIKTLRLLVLTSTHYALDATNSAIGVGPDPKDPASLVVYRIPDDADDGIAEADLPRGIAILLRRR